MNVSFFEVTTLFFTTPSASLFLISHDTLRHDHDAVTRAAHAHGRGSLPRGSRRARGARRAASPCEPLGRAEAPLLDRRAHDEILFRVRGGVQPGDQEAPLPRVRPRVLPEVLEPRVASARRPRGSPGTRVRRVLRVPRRQSRAPEGVHLEREEARLREIPSRSRPGSVPRRVRETRGVEPDEQRLFASRERIRVAAGEYGPGGLRGRLRLRLRRGRGRVRIGRVRRRRRRRRFGRESFGRRRRRPDTPRRASPGVSSRDAMDALDARSGPKRNRNGNRSRSRDAFGASGETDVAEAVPRGQAFVRRARRARRGARRRDHVGASSARPRTRDAIDVRFDYIRCPGERRDPRTGGSFSAVLARAKLFGGDGELFGVEERNRRVGRYLDAVRRGARAGVRARGRAEPLRVFGNEQVSERLGPETQAR